MALADYADTNYYDPLSGPIAVAKQVKDKNGKEKTVYVDAETGKEVKNLDGYTVQDGDMYYKPSAEDDSDGDGKVEPSETSQAVAREKGGSGRSVQAGGGPKGTASNNFGYQSKPGFIGPAAKIAGLVNPGVGAAIGVLGKAYNVNNMDAVNEARKGLGLTPTTGKDRVKQALKDNQGQIANVNIGDKKYSVGFEALSPDQKTNLTYNEAKQRAALAKAQITETPKDEVTPSPKEAKKQSAIGKALDHLFGTPDDPSLPDQAPTPTQRPGQVPDDVAAEISKDFTSTPDTMAAPSSKPENKQYSKEASIGLPDKDQGLKGPVGVSDPNDSTARAVTPGAGLANLAGSAGLAAADAAGVGPNGSTYSHPERGAWNAGMDPDTAGVASRVAGAVPGVNFSSTVRSPAINAAIGGAKKSAHMVGKAFDIDTSNLSDDEKQKAVEMGRLAGATRIGTYKDQSLHFDTVPGYSPLGVPGAIQTPDNTYGMFDRTAVNAQERAPGWFTKGMTEDRFAPTPTPRPDIENEISPSTTPSISQSKTFDSQIGLSQDQNPTNQFSSMVKDMSNPNNLGLTGAISSTKQPNTPAGLAAMGFTTRTPEEKAAISRTIAGELGQKSLAALASDDPVAKANAMAEVGSMVATMENRAATKQYSGIAKTLAPSQYNANLAANAAVTDQNYASNPQVSKTVGAFYSGGIPGTQYGATNYHATNMANPPSWSGKMTSVADIGQHTFGSLPGYSPSATQQSRMNAFGTMAGTQFSPGKAKDDADLGVYGGTPSANVNSVGSTPASKSSDSSKSDSGKGSSSSGSGSGGSSTGGTNSGGVAGSSNSRAGSNSPAGGYASGASKGSTGGL
jgi:hypothetical protein